MPAEFDPSKVAIVFVLGGPGSGKGTQCARLVKEYGFVHLSAGDLLREEQSRPDSQYGSMIAEHIRDGKIVPMHVTISLLRNAIEANLKKYDNAPRPGWAHGHGRFLIDGFPRKMDQAVEFEKSVCSAQFVLFLHCTEEMMLKRLLHRGETSGRIDDNAESIKKRFRTFEETSMPVVDAFRKVGKVAEVDSMRDIDSVYAEIEKVMKAKLIQH